MPADLPIVLVPGLGSSVRTHLPILPTLWRHGSLFVANQTRDDTIAAMAARVLSEAPPKFSLIGHSLGGYIVLEMIRQQPNRIVKCELGVHAGDNGLRANVRNLRRKCAICRSGRDHDTSDAQNENQVS